MSYLVKFGDVSDAKINPLEGGDTEANAAVPQFWTIAHVQRRMLEAFAIDDRMQAIESPKDPGSAHPAIAFTAEELEEQQAMAIAEQAEGTRAPLHFRPSLAEEAFMTTCFAWLLAVRAENSAAFFALRAWMIEARRPVPSHRRVAARLGMAKTTFFRRKDAALFLITSRLNADGVATF